MTPPSTTAFDLAARAWGDDPSAPVAIQALRRLGRMHRATVRADFARVHPTWLARAVQNESPAVRAIVAGFGPPAVKSALLASFGPPVAPARPPHPEILQWVLALWAERLVGGEPPRDDDPPIIVALTRLSFREAHRLCFGVGQAKRRLANDAHQRPEIRDAARRDVVAVDRARLTPRRRTALLGLATAARLLADCDSFRSRWALQHLPYPVVKQVRRFSPAATGRSATLAQLETRILEVAWVRLSRAERLATPCPVTADWEET